MSSSVRHGDVCSSAASTSAAAYGSDKAIQALLDVVCGTEDDHVALALRHQLLNVAQLDRVDDIPAEVRRRLSSLINSHVFVWCVFVCVHSMLGSVGGLIATHLRCYHQQLHWEEYTAAPTY